jgi:hypothetical protein
LFGQELLTPEHSQQCGVFRAIPTSAMAGVLLNFERRPGTVSSGLSLWSGSRDKRRWQMAPRESEPQKETVERVMHEFKHGELRSGASGQKVKNRRQAVAIALSEAGASNQQTPKENEQHLRHTKAKERRGETAKDETEGKAPRRRSGR